MTLAVLASLLMAAGTYSATVTSTAVQPAPGYEELSQNRNQEALRVLGARYDADDPSRLINLGTTYVRIGRPVEARRVFAAAVHSEGRTDLVLADGQIMDSRAAAKLALRNLRGQPIGYGLASRDLFRR